MRQSRHPPSGLQADALLVGGLQARRRRSRRRAAHGARGHRRRRLCRALLRHRARRFGDRRVRARGRRARCRRQHAQRRRRERRGEYRQELHRQGARPGSRGREGHHGVGPRRLQPDRDADRARADRLLLGEEGPLRRGLDAQGLQIPGGARRQPQRRCRLGRLHGAEGAPARGDGVRLLLRRHGGGALGQAAPRPLLQGPARRGPPAQDHDLRQGGGENHQPKPARAGASRPRAGTSRLATSSSPPTATPATRRRSSSGG